MKNRNKQAFTLIELLVVVLIIGILAAVALPQYQRAVEKARMAEGISLLSSLAKAEKAYFLANGEYTDNFNDLDIAFHIDPDADSKAIEQHTRLSVRRAKIEQVVFARPKQEDIYWRLYYYLDEDKIYCGTKDTEERGVALCKSFGGTEPIVCGGNNELVCYEVRY